MLNISIHAEEIFRIGSFPVTNSLLLTFIVTVLLITLSIIIYKRMAIVPKGIQNIAEITLEETLNLMDSILGDRKKSEKYLPLVLTIFLFVLFSNWFGLVPGVSSILFTHNGASIPLLRAPASDLNFTLALALISVILINVFGIATIGFKSRASVFLNFKSPVQFFVGILELISEFARIISFSFRLFGNVLAGEVLLAIMAFLLPYVPPFPFIILESFVGLVQAFVFAMLTLIFIAIAITDEHSEKEIVHA